MRTSAPIQELIADGVTVQKVDQPTFSFSRLSGGKNAPARADQRQLLDDGGA